MRLVSIDMISFVLFVLHTLMFSVNSCGEGLLFLDFSFPVPLRADLWVFISDL